MIKRSKKLNKMMERLYQEYDFYYIDDILTRHADYYTVSEKTLAEESVDAGVKLAKSATKKDKPIFEVECYGGDFSAYFVGNFDEVIKIFEKALIKASKGTI